ESRVVPANWSAVDVELAGATPPCQFAPVLQLLSAPPPVQITCARRKTGAPSSAPMSVRRQTVRVIFVASQSTLHAPSRRARLPLAWLPHARRAEREEREAGRDGRRFGNGGNIAGMNDTGQPIRAENPVAVAIPKGDGGRVATDVGRHLEVQPAVVI